MKAEYLGNWWSRVFKDKNIKVAVDWTMWKDEHELEDEMNDFSVEKMVDLMKKNGDWDENEIGDDLE